MSRFITRLDRLILAEIFAPFVGSMLLFTGLFFAAGELVKYAQFLQQGLGWMLIGKLVLYSFPTIISYTLPMAMLLGTLLGFGRLSGDSEITAMTAAGISFERIAVPVAVFGLLVSMIGYWFSASVVPTTGYLRHQLLDEAARKGAIGASSDALNLSLHDDHGGQTILHADGGVGQADPGSGAISMRRVSIVLWRNGVPDEGFFGQRAEWVVGTKNWKLFDGQHVLLGNNPLVTRFPDATVQEVTPLVSLDSPDQMAVLQREEGEVTTPELRQRIQILRKGGNENDARKAEVELARRGALPFASLVFAMIGAPLGVSPRREGKGVGFALSVLITFCYWIGLQVFSIVSQGGSLPPGPALAIPNIACFAIALFLNRRVLRG